MKKVYTIEGLLPPRLFKTNGKLYIVPQWIEVPADTTDDQVVHKLPDYLVKNKSVLVGRFKSSSSNAIYAVFKKGTDYSCDCPGFIFNKKCKHIKLCSSH